MRGFLYSPLGDELATRIQLQQPYHGLVESDVIIGNTKLGRTGAETEECVRRIASMLSRVRGASGRRNELFFCDPSDLAGKECKALLKALKPMCVGGSDSPQGKDDSQSWPSSPGLTKRGLDRCWDHW